MYQPSEIHAIHGVSHDFVPFSQTCRNYVSASSFSSYLETIQNKYVPWGSNQVGSILTVDDGTVGGADACILAREKGHEVIFFLNPYQIETGSQYFFCLLDNYLDNRTVSDIKFQGSAFNLKDNKDLKKFRLSIRGLAMAMLPDAASDFINLEVAKILKSPACELPKHLVTIDQNCVKNLINIGVRIESHGWDHRNIAFLDREELSLDMRRSKDWFAKYFNIQTKLYAVPFGSPHVSYQLQQVEDEAIFLLTENAVDRELINVHWNRFDITGKIKSLC